MVCLVGNVPDMSWTCLFLSLMSSNFGDMANVPGHGSWSVAQSRVWRACPPYKSRTKNALVVIRYLGALTQLIPAAGIKRARNTNNNNRPTNDTDDHRTSTSNTATEHENSVASLGFLASICKRKVT